MKKIVFLLLISCLSSQFCFAKKNDVMKDKFLIVLDIQEYYTSNKLTESVAQNFIDSVNYVINKTNHDNVIYVKSTHKLLNLSLSYPFVYVSFDTSAMRLDKGVNLVNDNIFTKDKSSAFTVKEINDFLKQNNAKEIVLVGLLAENCVYQTLLGGKDLGYDMYVVPESIIGKSQKSKNKVLKKLSKAGIKILNINM